MGDSQSRYSIVERLTERKLNLIKEKSYLDENTNRKEQDVSDAKKALLDYDKDAKSQVEQQKRLLVRSKENAEIALKNAKENKKNKLASIDQQIVAVNEALKRIEEVSKNAGKEQQS